MHLASNCKLKKYIEMLSRKVLSSYNHLTHAEGIALFFGNIQICETFEKRNEMTLLRSYYSENNYLLQYLSLWQNDKGFYLFFF